jgi:hypothetical protein
MLRERGVVLREEGRVGKECTEYGYATATAMREQVSIRQDNSVMFAWVYSPSRCCDICTSLRLLVMIMLHFRARSTAIGQAEIVLRGLPICTC